MMEQKKRLSESSTFVYVMSFALSALIAVLAFLNQAIWPGGTNTPFIYDMKAQLIALYGYLSHCGNGFDSLVYSMAGGVGGGYMGTMALYVSPFDLIYSVIPLKYLPDAVYFLIILRIAFSGLFCSLFIRNTQKEIPSAFVITVSCCYALMSYDFMYSMSPMWLDLVMLMPLLALSLEKVIEGKRSPAFILLMAFGIICDYYIAYMCVIAIVMYFFFRLVEDGNNVKDFIKKTAAFAVHGIVSAMISAFVVLPVILDFSRGKLSEDIDNAELTLIKNSVFDVIGNFAPTSYSTLESNVPPNIFCGSLVLITALAWFILGKKNIRGRIAGFFVVVLYFISFTLGPVDRIWHGFRDPVGFPMRYAFTFVFFMIVFSVRGFGSLKGLKVSISKATVSLLMVLAVIYTFAELYFNGAYILSRLALEARYANRDEYDRYVEAMASVLDIIEEDSGEEYYRVLKDFNYSRFDGALFGYDGLERFSSSYNYSLSAFLSDVGIGTSYHTISEKGVTPPMSALFDMEYLITWGLNTSSYYEYLDEYKGFIIGRSGQMLPLMFPIDNVNGAEFCDDPFENINILFSDLASEEFDGEIFTEVPCVRYDRDVNEAYGEYSLGFADIEFEPVCDGYYWFYSSYVDADTARIKEAGKEGNYGAITAYADYYLDDTRIGMFRVDEFTYCDDLGYLYENTPYKLSLDTSLCEIGDTCICRYDDDLFAQICDDINAKGFSIDEISGKGITAHGSVSKASALFVCLPFEKGYEIFVDGQKTDYSSYRDAFVLIDVPEGEHTVEIRYCPPGLKAGLAASALGVSALLLIIFIDVRQKRNGKKENNG